MNTPKKQTAVAWLTEQIKKDHYQTAFSDIEWIKAIETAMAMEKEQIEEAWKYGYIPTFLGRGMTVEQYYTETYGPLPDDRGETNQTP